jgi:type I restriction-modification system DNA methylase subunit
MATIISGLPENFANLLAAYHSQISDAIRKNSHHDHRRALLMDFLRKSFGIEVDEVELEKKIKVAEARGRIDAFYKYVIFEVKIDLERERSDALSELKKYFESRTHPNDYIAVVTDGIHCEIFDYDSGSKQPREVRPFEINPDAPEETYLELDELLASGKKIPPTSDDIVGRFGLKTMTFLRSLKELEQAFDSVEHDSSVSVKFKEWNSLLAKVYGSAVGNKDLFLRHTYLTILSRTIVTMVLFPKHVRGHSLYRDLLTGKFFRDQSILNLAEPDFFSWALDTNAESPFFRVIDSIFKRLEEFDWTKLDQDLLKMLYQELIDPEDRSGLGEFYTPDWLAELILEDINYKSGVLLDPACGSGTFLFSAINRLREHGFAGKKLVKYVMESIIGLDVHPVAVLMAKANMLLALAPELKSKREFDVQLRVYMSDTLQTVEKKGKNYLAVPDGTGREFTIPIKSLEMRRDLDQIIDQMAAFAQRGAASETVLEQARKGFLAKIKDLTPDEINLWNFNFALMADLVKTRRDTVWAFILRNAYRPAYLRNTKVDVIVGNPPWLSFRDIAEEAYKDRIKDLTFGYELLEKSERKLFTQMDTSTLFFIHCAHEFLTEGGKIAFVMPKTVILPAKQHAGFQRNGVTRIHDFSKVTVTGLKNQHFFNVKSCVIVTDGPTHRESIPMTVWEGVLPKKNLTLGQSRHMLHTETGLHDFLDRTHSRSPYFSRAFQGATLNPHTLWFVEPDPSVPLNSARPMLRTSESAYRLCKEKKWKLKVRGPVESSFLYATVLSDDILPFFVRGLTLTVLPLFIRDDRYIMMNSGELLSEGFEAASDWVKRAEKIFAKGTKNADTSAQGYLNYQQKLTQQNAGAQCIVLYNKSGTNLSAGYITSVRGIEVKGLEVQGFVAESVTYRIYTKTEDEALYLIGILNSTVVNKAIKPYQTEGVYHGKRDIHRRPFEVCAIPEFDSADPAHRDIVKLSRLAKKAVEKWGPAMEGGLANVRERTRTLVAEQLRGIDVVVESLLGTTERTIVSVKKDSDQALIF